MGPASDFSLVHTERQSDHLHIGGRPGVSRSPPVRPFFPQYPLATYCSVIKADWHHDATLPWQPLFLLPGATRTREERTFSQVAFVILPNLTCSTRSKGSFGSLIRGAGARAGFLRRRQTTCGGFSLTFKSRARYHARAEPGVSTLTLTLRLWESDHRPPHFFFFLNMSFICLLTLPQQLLQK